jgi:hypothetical protein
MNQQLRDMGVFKGLSNLTKAECENITKNCLKKIEKKKHMEIDNMVNQLIKMKKSEVEQLRLL